LLDTVAICFSLLFGLFPLNLVSSLINNLQSLKKVLLVTHPNRHSPFGMWLNWQRQAGEAFFGGILQPVETFSSDGSISKKISKNISTANHYLSQKEGIMH
jgi:hypothetical protein